MEALWWISIEIAELFMPPVLLIDPTELALMPILASREEIMQVNLQRFEMIQTWADYLDQLASASCVSTSKEAT